MNINELKKSITKLYCALDINRKIIGVKFLFTEEEFNQADAETKNANMYYCVMVKSAMSGNSIKVSKEYFSCLGSARSLGIIEPEEIYRSGRHYLRSGIYSNLVTAKNVYNNMTLCQHSAYGIMIKPLEKFKQEPDIVMIITNPYNVMRIVQGYTYKYGTHISYKMSGNQAVCSECTSYPFESNNINVSMLCGGTRNIAGWKDDELGIGIPFNRFVPIVDGVYNTINPQEPNRKKSIIEKKLIESNLVDLKIEYNKNYYRKKARILGE